MLHFLYYQCINWPGVWCDCYLNKKWGKIHTQKHQVSWKHNCKFSRFVWCIKCFFFAKLMDFHIKLSCILSWHDFQVWVKCSDYNDSAEMTSKLRMYIYLALYHLLYLSVSILLCSSTSFYLCIFKIFYNHRNDLHLPSLLSMLVCCTDFHNYCLN